ncbi:MAG: protein phosphatase 2C domain-containing protein [Pseudomonadota bacterium]
MWRLPEPRYDVASALSQGQRDYQEDALVTDFPFGDDSGIVVLADGMGGHAAGDVASKIVVTEVYGALKRQSDTFVGEPAGIPGIMGSAAVRANASVREHVLSNPGTQGMGATLVSLVLVGSELFWNSIGDSPLFLMRKAKLQQLNEDHSMAPQIDFMVQSGLLDAEAAKNHPDRNCLTSVIYGDKVAKVDCPDASFQLEAGDIVVLSSDGLQYLEDQRIERLLHRYRRRTASEIAGLLLSALEDLNDPDQDNISISVIKVNHTQPIAKRGPSAEAGRAGTAATRVADKSKIAEYAHALFGTSRKAAAPADNVVKVTETPEPKKEAEDQLPSDAVEQSQEEEEPKAMAAGAS